MAYMKWDESFSVGVTSIDVQHKKLIDMINEFYEAMNASEKESALKTLLYGLDEYARNHFSYEERLFEKYNYGFTAEHKKEHKLFIDKINEVKEKIESGKMVLTIEITNYLKKWLTDHIKGTDKKYSDCFVKNGVK